VEDENKCVYIYDVRIYRKRELKKATED